jgi:hypothetical protein
MTLRSLTLSGCLAAAMVAAPVLSLAATKPTAPERDRRGARTEALELLKQLQGKAYLAAEHASELQSTTHSPNASWQIHALRLEALKEDVNTMGRQLSQLETIRDSATPWERKAIDEAAPLLRLMADNIQAAMKLVSDTPGTLWVPAYQKHVDNLAGECDRLHSSVGQVVKFAKVHANEQHLERTLGISAASL